jgi:hypothetical protein
VDRSRLRFKPFLGRTGWPRSHRRHGGFDTDGTDFSGEGTWDPRPGDGGLCHEEKAGKPPRPRPPTGDGPRTPDHGQIPNPP